MISKEALMSRLAKIREQSTETVGTVLQTAEVAGAAAAFSWANGRYGDLDPKAGNFDPQKNVMGVPVDLAGAVLLHGLSFTGMLGKHKEHGHNLGDGALASYACRTAMTMGLRAKSKAGQPKAIPNVAAGAWQYAGAGQGVG